MKRLLCPLLALLVFGLFCGSAGAEVKVGFLTQLNIAEEEYRDIVLAERKEVGWTLLSESRSEEEKFVFYDSLMLMQMALNAGEIAEAALPKVVGEYVLNTVPNFTIASVTRVKPVALVFGFYNGELRDRFNDALFGIKEDGTLLALKEKYLLQPGTGEPEPVQIERYRGAETVRVAVTGDLPPIDFIAADGKPAGFNTAVLAVLGKALRVNIEFVNAEAGSRTAALASGRADVVFWYQSVQDDGRQTDIPEGVLLSTPYYNWNKFLYLKRK